MSQPIPRKGIHGNHGFTLIEMIGVLAIVAILIAALSPRIFDAISDSRITSVTSAIKTYESAVTKYYSDVGTLLPLNNAGVAAANNAGTLLPGILTGKTAIPNNAPGLWSRVTGSYLEKFATPAIGNTIIMPSVLAVAGNVSANNFTNFDLNNDGVGDFAAGDQLVSVQITGITLKEFKKLDKILDDGIGTTDPERQARGRVKYQNVNGGTVRVYIANK